MELLRIYRLRHRIENMNSSKPSVREPPPVANNFSSAVALSVLWLLNMPPTKQLQAPAGSIGGFFCDQVLVRAYCQKCRPVSVLSLFNPAYGVCSIFSTIRALVSWHGTANQPIISFSCVATLYLVDTSLHIFQFFSAEHRQSWHRVMLGCTHLFQVWLLELLCWIIAPCSMWVCKLKI